MWAIVLGAAVGLSSWIAHSRRPQAVVGEPAADRKARLERHSIATENLDPNLPGRRPNNVAVAASRDFSQCSEHPGRVALAWHG